jgi:hypothetical protein
MSQHSGELSSPDLYKRRTTMALVPVVVNKRRFAAETPMVTSPIVSWSAFPLLLVLGGLLECLLLALVPLLPGARVTATDPVQQAMPGLFPWLAQLYWTTLCPQVLHWLMQVHWLDPMRSNVGNANLQMLLLGVAWLLSLLAAKLGYQALRWRVASVLNATFLLLVLFFTALVGLTLLCAPMRSETFSLAMLYYGLYGRAVVFYHVNPYIVAPAQLAHDLLHVSIPYGPMDGGNGVGSVGPVWLDLCLLVALFAQNSIANVLFGLRLLGLVVHLLNVTLIWSIVGRIKPQFRLSATLLYAWNPLVLLASVFMVHLEVAVVLFLLLSLLFLLRGSPLSGWIFALLAVLMSPLYLIVLPLLLVVVCRQMRGLGLARLVLWWLTFWLVTGLVIVLAYAPYWPGLSVTGLRANLLQLFWQGTAINSLDAALLNLPVQMPGTLAWLLAPRHWSLLALAVVALFSLFSCWLSHTVKLFGLCLSWLFLLLLLLMPVYWPWYVLLPLALALCSTSRGTIQLAILLSLGGLFCYYFWLWQPVWAGQALLTVGFLFVVWGWVLFFSKTWQRKQREDEEPFLQYARVTS